MLAAVIILTAQGSGSGSQGNLNAPTEQVGLGLEQGPTCTPVCFDLVAPHLTDLVSKIYDQEKCKCSCASKIA
jgi:hypothetical protein